MRPMPAGRYLPAVLLLLEPLLTSFRQVVNDLTLAEAGHVATPSTSSLAFRS